MDQDTIQKIAQEVVKQLPNHVWQLLVVQVALTLLAFAAGIVFGGHLKTKVKNEATKADLDRPRDQLPGSAEPVDTVKADIRQEDWRTREWAHLRRVKLEALLHKMHDCDHYVDQLRKGTSEADVSEGRDPLSGLAVITTLYFPELKVEVDAYLDQCRARKTTLQSPSGTKGPAAPSTEESGADTNATEFEAVRDRLSAAARNLTTQIMGVAE